MSEAIYLDHHATTPVDPDVLAEMLPWFTDRPGNPHSRHHEHGWSAEAAVDLARMEISELISAAPDQVIFTSGATEANNWALTGIGASLPAERNRVVTTNVEHPCVLETARRMAAEGHPVTILPVEPGGGVDPRSVIAELDKGDVGLVSVMLANNEVGTIQPVAEIGRAARAAGALMHCDAAQALGRIRMDMGRLGVDLLSITAHKLYGPKGIGALVLSDVARRIIRPMMAGGGQQDNLRSGTIPTPLAVGFGAACRLAQDQMDDDIRQIGALRDRLWLELTARIEGLHLNGAQLMRLPGNLNFRVDGADADDIIRAAPEIAISTGSACSSESSDPSYVLQAIGLDDLAIRSSLRIGVGRTNTLAEIDTAVDVLAGAINKARQDR
ncbi:MAG: cysteine desulfurase family protein [Minwuia sp.]|nr:cysteine desulfurase family protein [Minwuia sp.]